MRPYTLYFLNLRVFQLHRCRTTKDRNGNFELAFFFVNFLDNTVEGCERSVGNLDLFADIVNNGWAWAFDAFLYLIDNALRFTFADWHGLVTTGAQKSANLWRVFDQVPNIVIKIELRQHITREEFTLRIHALTAFNFDDLLGRDKDFLNLCTKTAFFGLFLDCIRNLAFKAGVNVKNVPFCLTLF